MKALLDEVGVEEVAIVGHSMGAESGSMLAFSSFGLDPGPDCAETDPPSEPIDIHRFAGNKML